MFIFCVLEKHYGCKGHMILRIWFYLILIDLYLLDLFCLISQWVKMLNRIIGVIFVFVYNIIWCQHLRCTFFCVLEHGRIVCFFQLRHRCCGKRPARMKNRHFFIFILYFSFFFKLFIFYFLFLNFLIFLKFKRDYFFQNFQLFKIFSFCKFLNS